MRCLGTKGPRGQKTSSFVKFYACIITSVVHSSLPLTVYFSCVLYINLVVSYKSSVNVANCGLNHQDI